MNTPKFSIIIPVYNVEKFLQECLDSIVAQTLKDFEVICINDGSTDNSLAILNEYAERDSRFKVISQTNQGQGVARNNGIDLANGEYIIFVDPDDFIEPNALEIIYDTFKQTDIDIVQFDYATCRENGKYSGTRAFKKRMKKEFGYVIKNNQIFSWQEIKKKNLQGMSLCVWDKAYKTDLIKRYNVKLAPNKHGEEHIFSISANLLADKILYLNKTLYHYRTRLGSAVNIAFDDNFCIFENIELLKNFLIANNFYDEYADSFNNYVVEVLSWHYLNIPAESIEKYCSRCADILSKEGYEDFLNRNKGNFSAWEKIFSLKNRKINGVKVKYLTILGIKIKLPTRKQGAK